MVPNGWRLSSLGEICSGNLQTGPFGSQLHAHEYTELGTPVLMPKDLINFRANTKTAAKIPLSRANDLAKHRLEEGDLLFSRRGDVTRFALIDLNSKDALCGTGCLKARVNKKHSSLFLSYFLQKDAVKNWLKQNAVGQTMPNMNTAILNELPLMTASSKKEEDKIAKIILTWDKAITILKALIKNTEQQKIGLMQQMFSGNKRLPGHSKNWEEVKLKELLIEGKERNKTSKISRVLSVTNHSGFVLPEVQFSKRVASNNVSNYKVIRKGGFGYNPSRINVGSFARLDYFDEGILSPMYVIFTINSKKLSSDYFLHWMSSNEAKQRVLGSTQGSVRDSVSFEALCQFPFKLPTLQEQQKIASVLTNAVKEIELFEKQLADLKQEKKALMQQLLTGKRRVKIDEEAA